MRICPHNRQMEIPVCPYPQCHAGLRPYEEGVVVVFPEGKGNRYAMRMQTFSPATGMRFWWVGCNPDGGVPQLEMDKVKRLAFGEAP